MNRQYVKRAQKQKMFYFRWLSGKNDDSHASCTVQFVQAEDNILTVQRKETKENELKCDCP